MKGLIIKSPAIDAILDGVKTIEVRGCSTKIRGRIVLLQSGTQKALGTVEVVGCDVMTLEEYNNWDYRKLLKRDSVDQLPYKKTYKWYLKNPIKFETSIPYKHPNGAIIWVNLPDNFLE